jgi:hypothetical protein
MEGVNPVGEAAFDNARVNLVELLFAHQIRVVPGMRCPMVVGVVERYVVVDLDHDERAALAGSIEDQPPEAEK